MARAHVPGREREVGTGKLRCDAFGREVVRTHPVGIDVGDDGPDLPAERRRRRHTGQRREQRPHPVEGQVLYLLVTPLIAGEHELPDGNGTGIEAHDERGQGSGRHEGGGAKRHRDDLRH